jgi:AcrR family transcriptional regulator
MNERENIRDKIKQAAAEVFIERGLDGARMQEIADRAGANKAMIYYYFDSKEALFSAIFTETFSSLFKMFNSIFAVEEVDPLVVIPQLVHTHLAFLHANPDLPRMIVREMHSGNPVVEKLVTTNFGRFSSQVSGLKAKMTEAIDSGKIRPVDPLQTVLNLVALNVFVFIMRPALSAVFHEEISESETMLAEREKAIVDLVLNGLLPR